MTTLITGATGHIGRQVAELLAKDGIPLRLMARDPQRALRLPGAEVVHGDYADAGTLAAAFTGCNVAFIVSGYAAPGKRAKLHRNAIWAARDAGVEHIVYLSFQGASPTSKFPMSRDHYETEQYLRESGVSFTALRDNLYIDLIGEMFNHEGVLRGPAADGAAAFVAREDVARVAAAILRDPSGASGTYDVTGPEALTLIEVAGRLSGLTGRSLRYEPETVEEGRAWRETLDAPAWEVDTWLGSYEAIAAGELAHVSDTVAHFTHTAPRRLDEYAAEHPEMFG